MEGIIQRQEKKEDLAEVAASSERGSKQQMEDKLAWIMEKVRSFMTGTTQEQQKVLEELKTNDKELKQYYEMVNGYWQEQEEKKQKERQEFNKIKEREEEHLERKRSKRAENSTIKNQERRRIFTRWKIR